MIVKMPVILKYLCYTMYRATVVPSIRLLLGARSRGVGLDGRVGVVLGAGTRGTARGTLLLVNGLVERALLVFGVVRVFPLGEDAGLALLALLDELRLVEELFGGI